MSGLVRLLNTTLVSILVVTFVVRAMVFHRRRKQSLREAGKRRNG